MKAKTFKARMSLSLSPSSAITATIERAKTKNKPLVKWSLMKEISIREILLQYGKWISSTEFANLIAKKRNVDIRQAYNLIKKAYENREIQKHIFLDGSVWYGLPEFGPPSPTLIEKEIFIPVTPLPTLSNRIIVATLRGKFEELLRNFIREVLMQYCVEHNIKDWWVKTIPSDVRYRAETRRQGKIKEGKATIETPPINYVFFDDYKRIFEENWPIFQKYYKGLRLWQINEALDVLRNIRNAEAHETREITIKDIIDFEFYGFRLLCRESDKAEFEKEIKSLSISYTSSLKRPLFQSITDWIAKTAKFPKKEDFAEGLIYYDESMETIMKDLLINKRFCLIYGAPATRKTTFSINFGLEMMKQGYSVYYLEMKESLELSCDELLQEIKSHDDEKSIFIIDDCHKAVEKTYELAYRARREIKRAMILFVSRKVSMIDPEYDYFTLFRLENSSVEIKPIKSVFEGIIEKYCIAKGITDYASKIGDIDQIMRVCGNNILLLNLLLETWYNLFKEKEVPVLSDVTKTRFYAKIAEKYKLRENEDLFKVCALFQFEISVPYELLIMEGVKEEKIGEWLKEGLILTPSDMLKECYIMSHPSFAKSLLEVGELRGYLILDGKIIKSRATFTAEVMKRYLSICEPKLWFVIFQKIYSQRDKLSQNILAILWSDEGILEIMKEHIKDLPLGKFISLLSSVLWVEETRKLLESKKACEFRNYYFKYNYKQLQEKVKSSSCNRMLKYLRMLRRIKYLIKFETFFAPFSIPDFMEIIKRSSIPSIRILLFNLIEFGKKQPFFLELAKNIIKGLIMLPNEDLLHLLTKNPSVYRLGGLIGNIQQIDESLAIKFVEKLSQIDLNELFSIKEEDVPAMKMGFSKLRSINYFLSYRLKFTPENREKIIENISDETLSPYIQYGTLDEVMWLIWNVFRDNPTRANRLVTNNKFSLLRKLNENRESYFCLPFLGLLYLCGFNIHEFPFQTDVAKINQALVHFKEFGKNKMPSATAIVLLLLFSKLTLPISDYHNLRKILEDEVVHRSIFSHLDPRARDVFTNLIEKYQL